jgi:stage II sporulation protein D
VLGAVVAIPAPASAREGEVVEIVAEPGVRIELGGYRYEGPLTVRGYQAGLAVTERVSVDAYLEGIAEVPFSWDEQALQAQAVAARTYLAWTLSLGRNDEASAYDYDICATTACQVYAGVSWVELADGDRWRRAVEATTDQILVHEGDPAQALYSSTSGGRTRNVEDIFPGASPRPYLVGVESPGEDSPFAEWTFRLTEPQMTRLLDQAGLLQGELRRVRTNLTSDGDGSWTVEVEGSEGSTTVGTWELRTMLNSTAARVLPGVLPAIRPDGKPYPQTILSPHFTITQQTRFVPPLDGPPRFERSFTFRGNGWGHMVGMSQYGAQAMAERGSGYGDILAHYYGGLRPEPAGGMVPDEVTVGLATERPVVVIRAGGPYTVVLDGEEVGSGRGTWLILASGGGLRLIKAVPVANPYARYR